VAIVNDAFARRYFPHESAVGKRFGWGEAPKVTYGTEIIGVARNTNFGDLRGEPKPLIYVPTTTARFLMVRAEGSADTLAATLRREIQALDGHLEFGIRPVSDDIERALVREKLLAKLSSFFGVLAVILSALGLYGLMAYAVVSRTREIGIRMAIGAQRTSVLWAEMRSALGLVAIGMAIGAPVTLAGGQLIASQLFGVSAADPSSLALAIGLLALVSAVAAFLPARRASRVDPMVALRD
jgi:ABC-type antimicrobial peptide transport system permease subunit